MEFLNLCPSLTLRTTSSPSLTVPIIASSPQLRPTTLIQNSTKISNWVIDLRSKSMNLLFSGALTFGLSLSGVQFAEAKVGVNKPELLPKEFTSVIDVAGFLSDGQEKRLAQEIADIEKDTGFKLRVLAQNYPNTPGNILNFNVGASVDLDVPCSFWSRLAGKYGNMFYWKEKGEDTSIEAAVMAISSCLREPVGPNNCAEETIAWGTSAAARFAFVAELAAFHLVRSRCLPVGGRGHLAT